MSSGVQQYWEDESSADERQVAFHVDDNDDQDEAVIPTSAAEYLRMVRREASTMPNVFVADGDQTSEKVSESSEIANTRMAPMPAFAMPQEQWRKDLLSWFSNVLQPSLRKRIDPHPDVSANIPDGSKGSHEKWRRLIYDAEHHVQPLRKTVSRMSYLQINAALEVLDVCLGEVHPIPKDGVVSEASKQDGRRIRDDICLGHRAPWLFSLLSVLQLPLQASTAATLRSLLRKLTFARLAIESPSDVRLAVLNVLMVILSHHFGQGKSTAFQVQ